MISCIYEIVSLIIPMCTYLDIYKDLRNSSATELNLRLLCVKIVSCFLYSLLLWTLLPLSSVNNCKVVVKRNHQSPVPSKYICHIIHKILIQIYFIGTFKK